MLLLILAVKLVCEVAVFSLAGRAVLGVLIGPEHESNWVYGLLGVVVKPFVAVATRLSPRFVPAHHHPVVAFALLVVVWLAATLAKIFMCIEIGVARCS